MAKERQISMQFSRASQQILFSFLYTSGVCDKRLDPENLTTFEKLSDGVIIAQFFQKYFPKYFQQEINTQIKDRQDRIDNWNLCLQALINAGVSNPDISIDLLLEGEVQHIGMLLWDIVKLILFDEVKSQPDYLKYIFKDVDYRSWDLDIILVNWVNKILSQHQISRRVVHITEDFKDSFIYITLMDIILETGTNILSNEDTLQKAKEVVISSSLLERESVITEDGILLGVYWQNISLLSSLFITAASLCPME